jgi:hypothetical protein
MLVKSMQGKIISLLGSENFEMPNTDYFCLITLDSQKRVKPNLSTADGQRMIKLIVVIDNLII